jgi:hypothetical protein
MSRYSLQTINEGSKVDVGYDPVIDSYFLQVRTPDEKGELHLRGWRGDGNGALGSEGVVSIPEEILAEAAKFAVISGGLLQSLIDDRPYEPVPVESGPVLYAGMRNMTVWSYRGEGSSATEQLIAIRPESIFDRDRILAKALLHDFFGQDYELRARRIAKAFATIVLRNLPRNRCWLLTEQNMQEGIYAAELQMGLVWIPKGRCYAGEGDRTQPEAQLHRAEGFKCPTNEPSKLSLPLEMAPLTPEPDGGDSHAA